MTPDAPLSPSLKKLGLTGWPFPRNPAVSDLYHFADLDEVEARLDYAHTLKGFALLTGEPGSGKSTALALFAQRLDRTRHPVLYLADSRLTPSEFYGTILEFFGVHPVRNATRRRNQFRDLMTDLAENRSVFPVIVIDEAHELSRIMVQELRYVQNLGLGQESVFTLILSGQAELRSELRMKDLEAVSQRVTVRCHLAPLGLEDTAAYIRHGLKGCSVERTVFTDPAIALIHAKSRGLMRRVGSLATQALLDAALDGRDLVEEANVERAFMDSED